MGLHRISLPNPCLLALPQGCVQYFTTAEDMGVGVILPHAVAGTKHCAFLAHCCPYHKLKGYYAAAQSNELSQFGKAVQTIWLDLN